MPNINASVGIAGSTNKTHDVALVQAMLRVIKKNNVPFLGGNYDGVYGGQTKTAITKFQNDYKLIGAKSIDKLGQIMPNGETIKKLNILLPAAYTTMRIITDAKTVYLEGTAADATQSKTAITGKQDMDPRFRVKIGQLVQKMFDEHKIVLQITKTGWRRTFAEQAAQTKTGAGPGESNHNFGRAVDIGFKGLQWLRGDGTIVKDSDWLNQLNAASPAKATAMWDARDAIALKSPIAVFRLNFERVHLQNYNQATASSSRSLAALLNFVGAMKWAARYKCDLSGGKQLFPVGTAKQIWAGLATVSKAEIAKAKGVAVKTITAKDVQTMRKALKAELELADQNWKKWKPVP